MPLRALSILFKQITLLTVANDTRGVFHVLFFLNENEHFCQPTYNDFSRAQQYFIFHQIKTKYV